MTDHRTFFVTSNAWEKRALFGHRPNAELFLQILDEQRKLGRGYLHEFVLMPDHFHLLITPAEKNSLEKLMQYIKGGFSFRYNRQRSAKLAVWQEGFTQHRIHGTDDYARHREYIHENPVRASLVEAAAHYEWSSANAMWQHLLDPELPGLKPLPRAVLVSPA
jgi:putative transposase